MAINIKAESDKLAKLLETAYKNEIKKQKLIDTGDLLRTFKVSVNLKSKKQVFKISANEYFVYLDEEYDITKNVLRSSEYKRFEKGVEDLYLEVLTDSL